MEVTPGLAFKAFVSATAAAGLLDLYMVQKLKEVSGRFTSPAFGATNLRWVGASPLLQRLVGATTMEYLRTRTLAFPAFELALGVMVVLTLYARGLGPEFVRATLLLAFAWPLAIIAGQHYYEGGIAPDVITLTGLAVGVLTGPLQGWEGLFDAIAGTAVGGGILLAIYGLWWLARREEGLGIGTIKTLAMIGAFSGWRGSLVALFFASMAGAVSGLYVMARDPGRTTLPFAMYLALAGIVAAVWGDVIASFYVSLL